MANNNVNDTPNADATAIPDASTEPEAQATMPMATEPDFQPPRSSYEMPDDYETDWLGQTRQWVEENPVLAVAAAAGIGLVVGRLVMALVPEPEPPSFTRRVEKRAKKLRKDAAVYADDAGEMLAARLKKAANALSDAAEVVADKAETGYDRSKDLAEVVGDAVKAAVTGVVAKKADGWVSRFRG